MGQPDFSKIAVFLDRLRASGGLKAVYFQVEDFSVIFHEVKIFLLNLQFDKNIELFPYPGSWTV